ncbi:nephrocystin-3 [Aspergillus udagawae]|uniref:Nephrocystin-3 n=1 Tax=Aspergillus udagawae TaxID=91492 RepID=A0A8H3S543_9EURO|nr:nephrocystin-3 [Aspergillus udagawae]
MVQLSHEDYTVAWISALPIELAAAQAMLDDTHDSLPIAHHDKNTYALGRIGAHNIVIACLPDGIPGIASAAVVAMQLLASFPSIRFGFMIGIGGGIPSKDVDIRLGDVVVSRPTGDHGGVVQYDLGKALTGGHFQRTGILSPPPQVLLTALAKIRANHMLRGSQIQTFLDDMVARFPLMAQGFSRPEQSDHLFQAEYAHPQGRSTCADCDRAQSVPRSSRPDDGPRIHYGLIASANQVVKDSALRGRLGQELGAYCVEMEAAGLLNNFPCLVIRGISDYADSHKNDEWQGFAAAAAAAYAKELLAVVQLEKVLLTPMAKAAVKAAPVLTYIYIHYQTESFRIPLDLATVPAVGGFVGHEAELDSLWDFLQPEGSPMQKRAILHGLGGIGKTQLAVQFARIHKFDFTAIFWLNGKDEKTLIQSLASFLPKLPGIQLTQSAKNEKEREAHARQVLEWLSVEGNFKWLLIFDNVDQYAPSQAENREGYDISHYFPVVDQGSIIITTRLPQLRDLGKPLPVRGLSLEEGVQLLLYSSGSMTKEDTEATSVINEVARKLANRLNGLPLAIVMAGSFISQTGVSFARYLQLYEQSFSELLSEMSPLRHYSQGDIRTTWRISYLEIQKRDASAAKLLLLISAFHNRDIWFELVESGLNYVDAPPWFRQVASNAFKFLKTMRTLIEFSLIETKEDGSYAMHPVVQDWCRHILGETGEENKLTMKAIALASVGYTVPLRSERQYWLLQQRLLLHADQMGEAIANVAVFVQDPTLLKAIQQVGNLYFDQGKLRDAEAMYQHALTGFMQVLGPDHASTLGAMHSLGSLYNDQGKFNEAEQFYQKALAGYETKLGHDHPDTLTTIHYLGDLYRDQGKLQNAELMYQRALVGREKRLGPCDMNTLSTVGSLANTYRDLDKFDDARKLYERALRGQEKALGPDHTATLRTVSNLGELYRNQGLLDKAEILYKRALTGYEKSLGAKHAHTLTATLNLGDLYKDQGKLDESEKIYNRAVTGYTHALGPAHTFTLTSVQCLGELYSQKGNLELAQAMYQRVFRERESILGPTHADTLESLSCLVNAYLNQNKLDEVEALYRETLASYLALSPNNIHAMNTLRRLGDLYFDQCRLKDAHGAYQQALTGYTTALGPVHPTTLYALQCLGNIYLDQGKLKEAEDIFQKALTGLEKVLGPQRPETLTTVHCLGNLYGDQGRLVEANTMYQRALTGREELFGPDHPDTLTTVCRLANLYRDQGNPEAEPMFQRALAGFNNIRGPDHPSTLTISSRLGSLYRDQGKLKEAEELYMQALSGFEKRCGPDHISTLATVHCLANLHRQLGRLKEAESLYQRALVGREKVLGPDHIVTLSTVNNLGNLYRDQKRLKEAEKMLYCLEDCHAITGRVESHIQPAVLSIPKHVDFDLVQSQKLVMDEPRRAADIPYVHTGSDALGNVVCLVIQIHPVSFRATAAGERIARRAGWANLLVG